MSLLEGFLAEISGPSVQWLTGKVYAVNADSTVTLEYNGGFIHNVGTLDHYTPAEGDIVHALAKEGQGIIILGSNNTPVTPAPVFPPGTPVIVNPVLTRTYTRATDSWTAGVGVQAPGVVGAWTYNQLALPNVMLEKVEIEIVMVSGGPPEFVAHSNSTLAGPLEVSDYVWRVAKPVYNVASWVPLPISWGDDLINGSISGFGLSSSGQSGTYSGTGRVRLTPLSVTN